MRFAKVALGVVAASLTFGAAQFASGGDLRGDPSAPTANEVNRASKADRISTATRGVSQAPTVTIRSSILADTSIAVRLSVAARVDTRVRDQAKALSAPRRTIACEPVVSALTEVAKLLQPGRCVT